MVATGLAEISNNTRLTCGTSFKIRSLILNSNGYGISSTLAVTASIELMALITTIYSKVLLLSLIPVDLNGGTTVKYCQTLPSNFARANSSLKMASLSLTTSNLSLVIAPGHLTPRPGQDQTGFHDVGTNGFRIERIV